VEHARQGAAQNHDCRLQQRAGGRCS